jgi:hypothetical protein
MPKVLWAFLLWGLLIGTFVAGFLVVAAWADHATARALLALPTEAERPGGGMVFEGVLEREPAPRESPLGASVAGWTGRVVSTLRSGKGAHSTTRCTGAELDGLVLADPAGAWRLPLALAADRPSGGEVTALSWGGSDVQLVLGPTVESSEIPAAMRSRCTLPQRRADEALTYHETQLLPGAQAVFLGCRRGAGLEACPQPSLAGGHLAVGDRAGLVRALLLEADGTTALMALIALLFSLVSAGYVYPHLRRYHRLGGRA